MDEATNKTANGNLKADKRLINFLLANLCVFLFFCCWVVVEPHMNDLTADKIDNIIVPWGWLAGFFLASLLTLQRLGSKATVIFASFAFSIIFTTFQLLACGILLPMFNTDY
jgi:hypothetical protein